MKSPWLIIIHIILFRQDKLELTLIFMKLTTILGIVQKVTACFFIGLSPTGDFSDRAKTAQTNIVSIQATISDAGRRKSILS
jgi:hypothetical protein